MSKKEKAPEAGRQEGEQGGSDDVKEAKPESSAGQEKKRKKTRRWVPLSFDDIDLIDDSYSPADAAKVLRMWVELIRCVNKWGNNPFTITLDALSGEIGLCRQTAKKRLDDLHRINLIVLKGRKYDKGGRFEITSIKVNASVPPRKLSEKVNTARVKKADDKKVTVHYTLSKERGDNDKGSGIDESPGDESPASSTASMDIVYL